MKYSLCGNILWRSNKCNSFLIIENRCIFSCKFYIFPIRTHFVLKYPIRLWLKHVEFCVQGAVSYASSSVKLETLHLTGTIFYGYMYVKIKMIIFFKHKPVNIHNFQ